MSDPQEDLTKIVRSVLKDPTIVLTPSMTAQDVPGWDSMNHVRIIVQIERQFRIKLDVEDILSLKTIGDLQSVIVAKTLRR